MPLPRSAARLPTTTLRTMVGLLPTMRIPPPRAATPPVMVNESSTASFDSPAAKVTTGPAPAPRRIDAGPAPTTRMALPPKSMFSSNVPAATSSTSPSTAASIAAWIDSPNATGMVAPGALETQANNATTPMTPLFMASSSGHLLESAVRQRFQRSARVPAAAHGNAPALVRERPARCRSGP
jgi:hypothetical protein